MTNAPQKSKSFAKILRHFVRWDLSYLPFVTGGDQTVGSVLIKYCLMWTRVSWRHGEKWEEIAALPRKERKLPPRKTQTQPKCEQINWPNHKDPSQLQSHSTFSEPLYYCWFDQQLFNLNIKYYQIKKY